MQIFSCRKISFAFLLLLLLAAVGCATSKPADTQVRYRPEAGEELAQPYLPENKVNEAVNAEIAKDASAESTIRNAVGLAELQLAKRYSPANFFANVELKPVKEGKNFIGYRIVKFSPTVQEFLKRFDEVPEVGDILISINNVRQNNPDDFMKVWNEMDQQSAIVFKLLRGATEGGDNSNVKQVVVNWPVVSSLQ